MRILISLPIYQREWILPLWLGALESQTIGLENLGFQFELGPKDDRTHDLLWDWHTKHPELLLFDGQINMLENHRTHEEGKRAWQQDEYLRMVSFRNSLIERAVERMDDFDYYFSLDSDVLLTNPITIERLASHGKDVVSPLMYMTPHDNKYPNAMDWASTGDRYIGKRIELQKGGLQQVDVPMAAIMMSPDVVKKTRYIWHPQGEDLGFASNLHKNKFKAYLDLDLYVPHVMHRYHMEDYLLRGDHRHKN